MRSYYQPPLVNFDPLLKLERVEQELARFFDPVPSRPTLYEWLEDGTLEGEQIGRGRLWYVYSSSLDKFIRAFETRRQQKLAA